MNSQHQTTTTLVLESFLSHEESEVSVQQKLDHRHLQPQREKESSSILSYSPASSKQISHKPLKVARLSENKENFNTQDQNIGVKISTGEKAYKDLKQTLTKLGSARQTPRDHRTSMIQPKTSSNPHQLIQVHLRQNCHRKKEIEPFSILKELELNETKCQQEVPQAGIFGRQDSYPLSTRDSLANNQDNQSTVINNLFEDYYEDLPSAVMFDQTTLMLASSLGGKSRTHRHPLKERQPCLYETSTSLSGLKSLISQQSAYLAHSKESSSLDTSDISVILDPSQSSVSISKPRGDVKPSLKKTLSKLESVVQAMRVKSGKDTSQQQDTSVNTTMQTDRRQVESELKRLISKYRNKK